MKKTNIYSAKRTAIGSFMGALSSVPAPQLGATLVKQSMKDLALQEGQVDGSIVGCVLPAGVGQAPARQVTLLGGLSKSVPALTINKVCGSGLKAVNLAFDQISLGRSKLLLAGGIENMSQTPFYLKNGRSGFRMGHQELTDGMILDGLWDVYNQFHMGTAAELCVKEYKFTREQQDAYAKESYERALKAIGSGQFKSEIVAVEVKSKKEVIKIDTDEEPSKSDLSKLGALRPAFGGDGTITAGNASSINDGAAMLVLGSEDCGLSNPMARILHTAEFAHDPAWFSTAPVSCVRKLLQEAGLKVSDIKIFEINEAFSAVAMAAARDLEIPRDRLNPRGGAVALGHPIGASGARILVSLIHQLQKGEKGVASLCIGGGEAIATLIERL
jgi:acetyl-CoA C-acetyltransferase